MNSPRMWTYWRDEKGLTSALKDYYPDLLAKDAILNMAYSQMMMAKLAIEARMKQLADEVGDDEDGY